MAQPIQKLIESLFEEISNKYSGNEFTKDDLMKMYMEFKCEETNKPKIKDLNAPKKNLNIYMIFCREMRKKHPDVKHTTNALKTMWADCDDKEIYKTMAGKEKKKYIKALETYKQTDSYKEFQKSIK